MPKSKEEKRIERNLRAAKFRLKHPDIVALRQSEWGKNNPEKKMLAGAKNRAKEHGLEFSIDVSDVPIPEYCPLLGIPIVRNYGIKGPIKNSPSIDRINPTKGYVKGNVWVISWRANLIKRDGLLEDLENILNATEEVLSKGGIWYPSVPYKKNSPGMGDNLVAVILKRARDHGRRADIECSIEHSDIIIPDVCPILGIPLFKVGGKPTPNSPSLDRIDSSKGYVKGNVWVVSWRANWIKNNSTISELKILIPALRQKLAEMAISNAKLASW